MKITHVSLYVRDQDAAVAWYADKLGFEKVSDIPMVPKARWLTVRHPQNPGIEIVMEHESMAFDDAMAADMRNRIGRSGTLVMEVADLQQVVADLKAKQVQFAMEPTEYPWAVQAVMLDLDGNSIVLSQPPVGGYPIG